MADESVTASTAVPSMSLADFLPPCRRSTCFGAGTVDPDDLPWLTHPRLPVEVIDSEASPNRDAPSGVAEHTAPLIRITDQHESDGELLVQVIDAEASPSGVAKHTTPLNPITEQYELLTWIADAVHQAPPDQLQEQTDVSRNNVSQTAKVLTMTSDEKNCWTHSFGTFSGRASKASAANFR